MSEELKQIRESKFKVGDVVKVLYYGTNDEIVAHPDPGTITEVVYDLDKHTPDTHMYVVKGDDWHGLWFESELVEVEE